MTYACFVFKFKFQPVVEELLRYQVFSDFISLGSERQFRQKAIKSLVRKLKVQLDGVHSGLYPIESINKFGKVSLRYFLGHSECYKSAKFEVGQIFILFIQCDFSTNYS